MSNTICITITTEQQSTKDELVAQLSNIGFDAFEETATELLAFVNEADFDQKRLLEVLALYDVGYSQTIMPAQNWNAVWESNFDPVVAGDFCAVRASFHPHFVNMLYEIEITPKMSFGTGHHATTYMMITEMEHLEIANQQVADFGTGTGVLAILAEKMGAGFVWAIDNDDWSIENATENVAKNGCTKVVVEKVNNFNPHQQFNIILANINKSVVVAGIPMLVSALKDGGQILVSGMLREDENEVTTSFALAGLSMVSLVERTNWICMLFEREN